MEKFYLLSSLNMGTKGSSEIFVYLYQTTRRHFPEDSNPCVYWKVHSTVCIAGWATYLCIVYLTALRDSDTAKSNTNVIKKVMIWENVMFLPGV